MDDVVPPDNFFFSVWGGVAQSTTDFYFSQRLRQQKNWEECLWQGTSLWAIFHETCVATMFGLFNSRVPVMFGLFNSRFVRTLTFDNYVFPLNFVCSQLISAVENLWSLKVTELRGAWQNVTCTCTSLVSCWDKTWACDRIAWNNIN